MTYTVKVNSPEESISLAAKVGSLLKAGDIIAYKGGLGAGKTTFTRGIAVGMGLPDEVSSPTFALVNEYRGPVTLYHFDMYRILNEESLETTGFYDYLDDECVIAIEWSENISEYLPENIITIEIITLSEEARQINITGDDRFENIGN